MPALDIGINLHPVFGDSLDASKALYGEQQLVLELLAIAIVVVLVVVEIVDVVLLPKLSDEPLVLEGLFVH